MTTVWRDERRTAVTGSPLRIHWSRESLVNEDTGEPREISAWGKAAACGNRLARALTDEPSQVNCGRCRFDILHSEKGPG